LRTDKIGKVLLQRINITMKRHGRPLAREGTAAAHAFQSLNLPSPHVLFDESSSSHQIGGRADRELFCGSFLK
jgi:hypothetical protein